VESFPARRPDGRRRRAPGDERRRWSGDDVLQTTATSNPWSSTTGTSLGDGEVRLEVTAASVVIESSFHCKNSSG
jgi:hypothetical protein